MRKGWEPLCSWLGKDVPKNEMLNGNLGADFQANVDRFRLSGRGRR